MLTIPDSQRRFLVSTKSDLEGNIAETRNVSFDKGYVGVSHSPRATFNEDGNADWDRVAAIVFNADVDRYFIETWDEPFQIDRAILSHAPTQITDSDHPNGGAQSDADWFDGKLAVTESNDLHYYQASDNTWTDTNVSLSTTNRGQHPMANFLSKACLAVANINTVLLYSALSATPTLLTTLTIPTDYMITSIKYYNQNLYVATRHEYGGPAAMFVWNGDGTAAQTVYEVLDAHIIHDIEPWQGTIIALTSRGSLEEFTGSGFRPLPNGQFPLYHTGRSLVDSSNIGLYHNVMRARGDRLLVAFSDPENDTTTRLDQPSGIWCYELAVGLYHRHSFSSALTYKVANPAINTTTDAVAVTQDIPTGTEVWYKADTPNGALESGRKYFAARVDATNVKIATTRANAAAGTVIDFTADDGSGEEWVFFPNIDFGQILAERPSALQTIDYTQTEPQFGVDVVWAADLGMRDDPDEGNSHLGSVSPLVEARGHIVTGRGVSGELKDTYGNVAAKYLPLQTELDRIVVKWRHLTDGREEVNLSPNSAWEITWTSATTFTTTQADWAAALAAYERDEKWEVAILKGAGSGILAHVSSIVLATGTYTVTIDESYGAYASGDKAVAVFRNWQKLFEVAYGDDHYDKGYREATLNKVGPSIQLKAEIRGIGTRLQDLLIDNVTHLRFRRTEAKG